VFLMSEFTSKQVGAISILDQLNTKRNRLLLLLLIFNYEKTKTVFPLLANTVLLYRYL